MKARERQLPIHIYCFTGNRSALRKAVESVPRRVLESKDCLGRTPLILAVNRNNLECATLLLKAGVKIDDTDHAGQTALHIACGKGYHRFVKLLLSYKASWMQMDHNGVTALHAAAAHPNIKCLSTILKYVKLGETDIQDGTKKTPLHWTAAYAYDGHIKLLLANGANICIPDEQGKTPLHWAAANPQPEAVECIRILIKHESNIINWQDYFGRAALHVAVITGSLETVYFLASSQNCIVDILDNAFCTPLHYACKKGFVEKADALLKKGANHRCADDNGATPLHYAAYCNHADVIEILMCRMYITDEIYDNYGRNALMWAVARNAESAVKTIASKMNPSYLMHTDKNKLTALHIAAVYGYASILQLLISFGMPVDMEDNYNMTPFLKACQFGRSASAQVLMDCGTNINAHDIYGCNGLHWCVRGGHAYLLQILLKRGVDVFAQDSFGMTPLHYTSLSNDYINCTSVLLESGASPDIADIEGKIPLHTAVLNKRTGIVRLLLEYESNLNSLFLMQGDWVTPLDCALLKQNKDSFVSDLLRKFGGLTASHIKEIAAQVIQVWIRTKLKQIKKSKNTDELSKHNVPLHVQDIKCKFISSFPLSIQKLFKRVPDLNQLCSGQSSEHELICRHISSQQRENMDSAKKKAAVIIQKAWRRYLLKHKFKKIRQMVSEEFEYSSQRSLAELQWKHKMQSFYSSLYTS